MYMRWSTKQIIRAGKWPQGSASHAILNTVSHTGCVQRIRPTQHPFRGGCWKLNDIAGVNNQFCGIS